MKTYVSPLRVLLTAAAFAAAAVAAHAAGDPPELLSYQGYLVDANGAPLGVDGTGNPLPSNYDVTFSIFSASSGGDLLWREQQTITVDAGYFSVLLGEGTQVGSDPRPPLSEVFTGIGADERFIGVAVRFEAGGEFSDILPRLRLLTSPYAFLATQARSVVNPEGDALITADGGTVTVSGTLTATQPIVASGASMTDLNASNIASGTLSLARIPGLPASQITSGTLSDARLSTTVARRNVSNSFTSTNTFSGLTTLSGGARLNDNDLYLRSDTNHGIGWYAGTKNFAGQQPNGPVVYGFSGGRLGTRQGSTERIALQWTHGQIVHLPGQMTVGTPQWSSSSFGTRVSSFTNFGLLPSSVQSYDQPNEEFQFFVPGTTSVQTINYTDILGFSRTYTVQVQPRFRWLVGSNIRMTLFPSGNLSISGTLSEGSDRNQKTNLVPVRGHDFLSQLADLPVYEWSYIEGPSARHIGPTAQDFHAAFGLGANDTSLAPRDLAGVAVAALQGLHAKVQAQEAEIADLRATVTELSAAVAELLESQDSGE
ncbi:MAG: tail fiber domain-containing protein [Opitutales bacterium]|nr:tail fiber domain-containing protein [Opitutales bacterium]